MGLCHSAIDIDSYNDSKHLSPRSKFTIAKLMKSRVFFKKPVIKNRDHFFINYIHSNSTQAANESDLRRAVFVSLLGIYLTWKQVPFYMLYTALFLLPLKREWIYDIDKYEQEIRSSSVISDISPFSDIERTQEFIELLKWKDNQGLICWMEDEYDHEPNSMKMIHPFWYHLNQKLTTLYDPITGEKYKPLNLDLKSWENTTNKSIFGSIMNELYFLRKEYRGLQKIIYASNPNSFRLMTSYTARVYEDEDTNLNCDLYDGFSADDDADDWWISSEYDPYDIDANEVSYE